MPSTRCSYALGRVCFVRIQMVFVTTLTLEVFMIVTKPTDLIEKIKDAVFDARGVPQSHQRLIFDGKQL